MITKNVLQNEAGCGILSRNTKRRPSIMSKETTFTSPKIAKAMARVFGSETKTFSLEIQHRKVVGDFVSKIEAAHKRAEKSKHVFTA